MRIYVPATFAELDQRHGLAPRLVHAVTPGLRAALPDEDEEGLEYAAQLLAADDSLERLADVVAAPRRRVVITVDVPEAVVDAVDDAHAPSVVRLTTTVGWDDVACAHVDEADAEADVVAALGGDDDAMERLAERDLLWYDASELGHLTAR